MSYGYVGSLLMNACASPSLGETMEMESQPKRLFHGTTTMLSSDVPAPQVQLTDFNSW